jgi:hypothetical protein
MANCAAIKDNGERCKGIPIHGTQWCVAHHPDYDQARKQGGVKGGKRGGRGRPLAELHALRSENKDLRERMIRGELDPRMVAVAIQSINVDARLIEATLKAKDQEEIEGRLRDLEKIWQARNPKRHRA